MFRERTKRVTRVDKGKCVLTLQYIDVKLNGLTGDGTMTSTYFKTSPIGVGRASTSLAAMPAIDTRGRLLHFGMPVPAQFHQVVMLIRLILAH